MRVKTNWLRELVDLNNISDEELVKGISLKCIEVETVEKVAQGTNLVIGKVLSRVDHPSSDHLSICNVNVGDKDLQIVCGASNVREGQTVIVALEGATLPLGIKIKHSKIRGVESNGMICSLQELGIEKKYIEEKFQNGIYYFQEEITPGTNALEALNLEDEVIELGLTPNRSDLMSMIGVSYDVSCAFNRKRIPLKYEIDLIKGKKVDVQIETDKCLSYKAMIAENVVIKPSPEWLKAKLTSFGCRSINNVVDITNYILALFGQPLHAFDYKKLGGKILVREAKENEKIVTLDNIERVLEKGDILITDGKKGVALGGVMGGLETEIEDDTTSIVIEAALFDQNSIRDTSTRLNLRSESSIRFEKGIDLNSSMDALMYTAYLLKTLAGATCYEVVEAGCNKKPDKEINITKEEVNSYLGLNLSEDEIVNILERLEFKVERNPLKVFVPNRRSDISIKADLIEEIIRMYGYDLLPTTLPANNTFGFYNKIQTWRNCIKDTLMGMGLNEVVTYSLVSEEDNQMFTYNHYDNTSNVELLMPLTQDHKVLRKGLIPSLLEVASYNNARKIKDLNIFELGKVYYLDNGTFKEEEVLSILMENEYSNTLWQGKIEKTDFFVIKGVLDNVFSSLKVKPTYEKALDALNMHPGRTAKIIVDNDVIGYIGEVHPEVLMRKNLKDVYVVEIKLDKLLQKEKEIVHYEQISKTPTMERDLALVVKEDIPASKVINLIKEVDNKLLKDVEIFDLYVGDKLEKGYKSIAVKLTFASFDALTDDVVNQKQEKILKVLNKEIQAELRKA